MGLQSDPFHPEQVDEYIENVTQNVQTRAPKQEQDIQLVQRLQVYYAKRKEEDILERAWKQIVQRYEKATFISSENAQKFVECSQQERLLPMKQAIEADTLSMPSQGKLSLTQRIGLFAALLLIVLLVGSLAVMLTMSHTNHLAPSVAVSHSSASPFQSITLSDSINQTNPASSMSSFTVGQPVWFVCTLNVQVTGFNTLTVKWYENGSLVATNTSGQRGTPHLAANVALSHTFTVPGNGEVEVLWNGQLVKTLTFSVKA